MLIRVELFLACDLWRSYSCACRASLVVEKEAVAQGEALLRRRCRDDDRALLDACPACSYARFAAEVAGVDPPPPMATAPATTWEAAERTRRLKGTREG